MASSTFSSYVRSIADRCQSTSAPAQKLGPSPARTTARASPTSENASVSSAISAASKALRRSGRASVTRRIGPSRSMRSALMAAELRVEGMLRGAIAAAVTPLRDEGRAVDEDPVAPYVDFLAAGGVDGILPLGTTGEGILLTIDERRRVAERFVAAADGRLQVAVHAGAQTTADTAALAAHAAEAGADAVAVIGPPYYPLDDAALLAHFTAAARACEPLPFYLYEFKGRAGYSIPPAVIECLRETASNLRGLKVSNQPFEAGAVPDRRARRLRRRRRSRPARPAARCGRR